MKYLSFTTAISLTCVITSPLAFADSQSFEDLIVLHAEELCINPLKSTNSGTRSLSGGASTEERLSIPFEFERKSFNNLVSAQAFDDPIGNIVIPDARGKEVKLLSVLSESKTGVRKSKLATSLETSTENSRAAISWNRTVSAGKGAMTTHGVQFSAPLSKSGDTQLNRFGDFASDAKFSYSFSHFTPAWEYQPPSSQLRAQQDALLEATKSKVRAACPIENKSEACGEQRRLIGELSAENMLVQTGCGVDINAIGADDDLYTPVGSFFYGGSASIGYQSFDFKDPVTFDGESMDKTPWSVELFVGRYSADRSRLYRAGYTRVENFKAATSSIRCRDEDGSQVCENSAFSEPENDSKDIGFVEYRQSFGNNALVKAAKIKLSVDFDSNEPEVDIPLYMFGNAEGSLNGGVRATWSEEENAVLGIFVGSKFSIHP